MTNEKELVFINSQYRNSASSVTHIYVHMRGREKENVYFGHDDVIIYTDLLVFFKKKTKKYICIYTYPVVVFL